MIKANVNKTSSDSAREENLSLRMEKIRLTSDPPSVCVISVIVLDPDGVNMSTVA